MRLVQWKTVYKSYEVREAFQEKTHGVVQQLGKLGPYHLATPQYGVFFSKYYNIIPQDVRPVKGFLQEKAKFFKKFIFPVKLTNWRVLPKEAKASLGMELIYLQNKSAVSDETYFYPAGIRLCSVPFEGGGGGMSPLKEPG